MLDKRDISQTFRKRFLQLLERSGLSQAAFATTIGVDRSALTQLVSGNSTRLPRAETLINIAEQHKISLDWLLGLSQDEGNQAEIRPTLEIEHNAGGFDESLLATWHAEAAGTKIRYVPSRIPDLLRSNAVIDYETALSSHDQEVKRDQARYSIDYNQRPENDMEVCMSTQTLADFAGGHGIWAELDPNHRRAQLRYMARLVDDLYPTFRLYLFDGRAQFSIPYTVFGNMRAAIYAGDMYLVLNTPNSVAALIGHFDTLIRGAVVHAHQAAKHIESLIE